MAWPSGSKAPTTNVDSGTDSITSARADIKQNIDNVNDRTQLFLEFDKHVTVGRSERFRLKARSEQTATFKKKKISLL